MSRGLGRLQITILRIIEAEDRHFNAFQIAAAAYNVNRDERGVAWISDAQLAAVRRALGGLAKLGKIHKFGWRNGRRAWSSLRYEKQRQESLTREKIERDTKALKRKIEQLNHQLSKMQASATPPPLLLQDLPPCGTASVD